MNPVTVGVITTVAVVGVIHFSGWKLNPRVGMTLFGLYIAYVVFAATYGMS